MNLAFDTLAQQLKEMDSPDLMLLKEINEAHNSGDYRRLQSAASAIIRHYSSIAPIPVVSGDIYLTTDPPPVAPVLEGIFDVGDKVAVIGSSKVGKSWFLLQLAQSLASGDNFFEWQVPRPFRVLLVQLEVKKEHFHRRCARVARNLGNGPLELKDLQIVNGRGLGITAEEGIRRIAAIADEHQSEIVIIDPLYKILTGDENSAQDMKPILAEFDQLIKDGTRSLVYCHHDAKGSPGMKAIQDRGAGSGVLGRDYDACITLTTHENGQATVVDTILRNYAPQDGFTIEWCDGVFCERPDLMPIARTNIRKRPAVEPEKVDAFAVQLLANSNGQMLTTDFRAKLESFCGNRQDGRSHFSRLTDVSDDNSPIRENKVGKKLFVYLRQAESSN